jgi:hypothetical protein
MDSWWRFQHHGTRRLSHTRYREERGASRRGAFKLVGREAEKRVRAARATARQVPGTRTVTKGVGGEHEPCPYRTPTQVGW